MTKEELAVVVIDEIEEYAYVVDIEKNKLECINRKAVEVLGIGTENEMKCMPADVVLKNIDSVFDEKLIDLNNPSQYDRREFNEMYQKYFVYKYKVVELDGKAVLMGTISDITREYNINKQLKKQLGIDESLIRCIENLYENEDVEQGVNNLLSVVATYYEADRAYIFEIINTDFATNTHEWCNEGVQPQINTLQHLDMKLLERWMGRFYAEGEFYIPYMDSSVTEDMIEYKLLKECDVESLMVSPLMLKGKVVGFLGVDNPKENTDVLTLMKSVSAFIINDLQKRRKISSLYEISYKDRLTGLGNRHAYNKCVSELTEFDSTLGVVFVDINGLKKVNDLQGHEQGDKLILAVADIIKKTFKRNIYRIGGDEFVIFCVGINSEKFEQNIEVLQNSWTADVSAAVGRVWVPEFDNVEELVKKADEYMYEDKKRYHSVEST